MIVGFLTNTCEPFYRGGYERRTWAFARELARQGHEVRVYTSCPRDETIEGVRFVRLAAPRSYFNDKGVRNGIADFLFALSVFRLLVKLRRSELEVLDVCATPFLHLPIAALVARLTRIPLVLTCHEALLSSLPDYVRERGHRNRLMRLVMAKGLEGIYRLGMGLSARRIAVSKRTAAAMTTEQFAASAVIEFGLEPEVVASLPPAAGSGEVRFVFCGRLTPIKAVHQSLAALISLRAEAPWHFDIIGEGSELPRLRSLVTTAAAESMVTFHGELPEAAKRELLSRSEVFILSSPREGFSIATLEAMAQGCCAVVVSDPRFPNGALDFVRDGKNGLCIAPGLDAMVQALRRLLLEPDLRLRLRREAWKTAMEYQIKPQAERLMEFYRTVVSNSATSAG